MARAPRSPIVVSSLSTARRRLAVLAAALLACFAASAAAADDCGARRRLDGIDVSKYQGQIDWPRVKAAGIVFAFARVSDGVAVLDERFADNYVAMKQQGIRRGAYQYFRASADPLEQADLLVTTVRRFGRPDLPLVADVETDDGQPPEVVRANLKRWLRRVERRTHRRPMIYAPPSVGVLLARRFRGYRLWVAHYEAECPTLPDGWRRWTFWQHSAHGHVDGINGDVDLDHFAGPMRKLRRLNHASESH
jgi:lysozyme